MPEVLLLVSLVVVGLVLVRTFRGRSSGTGDHAAVREARRGKHAADTAHISRQGGQGGAGGVGGGFGP